MHRAIDSACSFRRAFWVSPVWLVGQTQTSRASTNMQGEAAEAPVTKEVLTGQDAAELLKQGFTCRLGRVKLKPAGPAERAALVILAACSVGTDVDVRTPEEYAQGHVPGSINIPNGPDFVEQVKQRVPNDTSLITACAHGRRAALTGQALAAQGVFKDIVVFKGSFQAWLDAGLPVEQA